MAKKNNLPKSKNTNTVNKQTAITKATNTSAQATSKQTTSTKAANTKQDSLFSKASQKWAGMGLLAKILAVLFALAIIGAIIIGVLIAYDYYTYNKNGDDNYQPCDPIKGCMVYKPAIYLYTTQELQGKKISVKLELNGKITASEPKYNPEFGWSVSASKDGLIEGKYDYLFYETQQNSLELPQESWLVEYSQLDAWLDEKLPVLGLNEKEKSQFKEYWLAKLPKSRYYEIKLLSEDYYAKNMRLIVEPKPDKLIRLNFFFKPLNKLDSNAAPILEPLIQQPQRTGFVVVEWGGILGKES